MRKGEEKIEDCMCGSSHHDLPFSLPDNFMKYIQMIRDQSFREWKSEHVAHDKNFPTLTSAYREHDHDILNCW